MAARDVTAVQLRQALDEAERECTVERFYLWYRKQIASEIQQCVPRPKEDKWDVFGNRTATYRFKEACEAVIGRMWLSHRRVVRARAEHLIEVHLAKHGDYQLMRAGGSTADMVSWMLNQIEKGQCQCAFHRRAEERKRKHEAAKALLSGESFARWVGEQIDEFAKDEPVAQTA